MHTYTYKLFFCLKCTQGSVAMWDSALVDPRIMCVCVCVHRMFQVCRSSTVLSSIFGIFIPTYPQEEVWSGGPMMLDKNLS